MPFYDYYCESNGQVVEAFHPSGIQLKTWKDLCETADLELGATQPDANVIRKISAPRIITQTSSPRSNPATETETAVSSPQESSPPPQTEGHVCTPACNHIRKKYGLDD